jgi:hypothetical protein
MVYGDRGSARAFAVNPLRLKTHPCGLRGLTALSTAKRGGYHAKIKKKRLTGVPAAPVLGERQLAIWGRGLTQRKLI